ncbi:sensor histidine kinase [Streptomyces tsukubensis]|uniref:sensor histidine kinase n=2 Tax=Streptomyces TaxID=1883 RepID=UPI001E62FE6F|nr:histidine kinase [Streptomyces tsukubensis]
MNRPWTDLVFDDRRRGVRALVYTAALATDFVLVRQPPGGGDRALAAVGLLLCLAGWRWALTALVAQSALLVTAHTLGAGVVPSLKVLAAITLFEVAVRGRGRAPAVGCGVLALAVVLNRFGGLPGDLAPVLFKAAVVAGLPFFLGSYVRMSREAAAHAREQAARRALRAEQEAVAARAAERAAIARELHDLVAHHVSSMVLRVGVARHVVTDAAAGPGGGTVPDPRVTDVLDDLHSSGRAALTDLRRLVAVLRAPGTEPGTASLVSDGALPAVLAAVAARAGRAGPTVTASVDPAVAGLDAVRALAVLRLAQEGLANVARHAGSSARADLAVRMDGGTVRLTLRDDGGAGRPGPQAPDPGGGHGLVGMRERVALLGGTLDAGPADGGWRLTAVLPAPAPVPEPRP